MPDFMSPGHAWYGLVAVAVALALLVCAIAGAIVYVVRSGNSTVPEAAKGIAAVIEAIRRGRR